MIFKTFNSNIDKWTAKIGIFGRSFNELRIAVNDAFKSVIDNIDNFDEDVGFWESLKNNLAPKNGDDKTWIKNSLGNIISSENINSYIAELDLYSAKEKVADIFDWEDLVKNDDATWGEYFDTLKDGTEKYIPDLIKNTDDLSKLTGEDLVKANQKAREAAIAHNQELQQQTLGAKAATAATKALAIAGNMAAMWVISKVVSSLYQLSQVSKDVAQNANELGNSFESTSSGIENYKSQIEDLYKTINDSTSSYEDNTTARRNLLTLQDEMIEKFGSEAESIGLVNDAINGQAEALDALSKKKWKETLNEFNDGNLWNGVSNFFSGYSDNAERMLDEYGNYTVKIDLTKFAGFKGVWGNDQYKEFETLLKILSL